MTRTQAKRLNPGDEVYWNDPDAGLCSRVFTIRTIQWTDDVMTLTDDSGDVLDCYAHELA